MLSLLKLNGVVIVLAIQVSKFVEAESPLIRSVDGLRPYSVMM